MANKLTLEMRIKSILEDQGLAGLATKLSKTEKEVDKLERKLKSAGKSSSGFGKELMGMAAGFGAAAFIKSAVVEFAKFERGLEGIHNQLRSMGQGDAFPAVQEALTALEDSGRAMTADTIPAFQKFLGATGDASAAMEMVRVATDLTESGFGDVSTNVDRLTSILKGRGKQAAAEYGIALDKTNDFGKDGAAIFEQIAAKASLMAQNQSQADESLDSIEGTMARVRREVGQYFAPALQWVADSFIGLYKSVVTVGTALGAMFDGLITGAVNFGEVLGKALNIKRLLTEGPKAYMEEVTQAWQKMRRDWALSEESFQEQFQKIWAKKEVEQLKANAEAIEKVKGAIRRSQGDKDVEAAQKTAEKELDIERKKTQGLLDAEAKLAQARAEMAAEGSDERLRLELAALEAQKLAEKFKERETVDALLAIDADYLAKKQALINTWWMKWLDDLTKILEEADRVQKEKDQGNLDASDALLQAQIDAAEEGSDLQQQLEEEQLLRRQERELADSKSEEEREEKRKRHQIEQEQLRKRFDNADKRRDQEKKERILEQTSAVFGQLAAIFPKFKAFAIAEAIINTWLGVTKILQDDTVPKWLEPIAIAATIATGMAQVSKIRSAKMAFGGLAQEPLYAEIAENAATRPEAVIPLGSLAGRAALAGAVRKGLAESGGAGTPATASPVNNYFKEEHHYHASVIRQERDMRQFNRKIRVNDRRDQSRFVQ